MATSLHNEAAANPRAAIARVLIADDQPDVLEALRLLLRGEGYEIETVTSPAAALSTLRSRKFDLLLMDLNYARDTTSGQEGLDLLSLIRSLDDPPPVVVMSGWPTAGLAIEAMHRGIADFVEKPWDNIRLLEILRSQIEQSRARRNEQREIEEAREIQLAFLPKHFPNLRGYDITGIYRPVRGLGGDYFDVLPFEENGFALCIGDVVGKGVPAALLMSNLQATVRGLASEHSEPQDLCTGVNRLIRRSITADRFITFFYGVVQAATKRLTYTNAGHNPPVLLRRDGSVLRLSEGGPVLGMLEERGYEQREIQLARGDRILLFTDGVTEAQNLTGEEFSEGRVVELLRQNSHLDVRAIQERILGAVLQFCSGQIKDDATLIVVAVG